jgi:hypothetical protein
MVCTDPTTPKVGSPWEHRWTGEQRRVIHVDDGELVDVHYADGSRFTTSRRLADWSAWAADAARIDAPRGQKETNA